MAEQDKNELLDHDADGIREYDNDLPRWWLYMFYFSIAFAVVYMGYYHFLGGPDSDQEYKKELVTAEYNIKQAALRAEAFKTETEKKNMLASAAAKAAAEPKAIVALTDDESISAGKQIFNSTNNLCFTCHRNDGGGMVGPNLTDDSWLHGCSITDVMTSIRKGFQDKGMMPYGSNTKLTDKQLLELASFVISLRGSNPPSPKPVDPARDKQCE
ncbi:MAG: cbb3-type cytochrome c oxidase N-terminal domain-containing protein [Bacteroidota bacterium]